MKHNPYRIYVALIGLVLFLSLATFVDAQDPTAIVENAYQDILGRKADPAGMRMFRSKIIDEGWTQQQVRDALRDSPENIQEGVDRIIKQAYEDVLNRQPDRSGMEFYKKLIINDKWSEKQVRDSLRQSAEYRNKHK